MLDYWIHLSRMYLVLNILYEIWPDFKVKINIPDVKKNVLFHKMGYLSCAICRLNFRVVCNIIFQRLVKFFFNEDFYFWDLRLFKGRYKGRYDTHILVK